MMSVAEKEVVTRASPCCSDEESDDEYEDAQESPLEQCISESMTNQKDNGLFSFVPKGVPVRAEGGPQPLPESRPLSNPDSFQDFFRLLAPPKPKSYRRGLPIPSDRMTYNLWSILKNMIGKDVTKIAMPVHLNEPLSFTQRLVEDIEYVDLLHKAAESTTVHKRLAYLAACASSSFVTTLSRHSKPFNPLLGETYELVNGEGGYCVVTEQVSHHPPITALHAEAEKWVFWEEYRLDIKFRGQWLRVQPEGVVHFRTKADGYHYSWKKPHTTVHNLILGSLWADHEGDVVVRCHQTGDEAVVTWLPYSKAKGRYRELNGKVVDAAQEMQFLLHGAWDKGMTRKRPDGTGVKELWTAREPLPNSERQFGFTHFALTLNEEDDTVSCPTDSRKRPDQRLLEEGDLEAAGTEKQRLEEKQRAARRQRGLHRDEWKPRWFDLQYDTDTDSSSFVFNGKYWDCKLRSDWSASPDIF